MRFQTIALSITGLLLLTHCAAPQAVNLKDAGISITFPSEDWKIETQGSRDMVAALSGTEITLYISPIAETSLEMINRDLAIKQTVYSITNSLMSATIAAKEPLTVNGIDFYQIEFTGQTKGTPTVYLAGRAMVLRTARGYLSLIFIGPVEEYRQFESQLPSIINTIKLTE
ncbi:MAG: hypothetical protein A2014_12560 [Spirochaetes bacterium GWF1_49_6]|nr:MAG: hypothetical protein A2014_12560 [Spirochaetes bacterium GWF1_49_6]